MFRHRRRGKVNLTYISDDSTRRVTFKKRNKGLFKKMNELTTLCDVKACAVVYDPDEGRPVLFPNDPLDVFNVISEFRKLSVSEQKRKMFDQEDYLNERITKIKEQLSRLRIDNRERRLTQLMYELLVDKNKGFDSLSIPDLRELNKLIDRHAREIEQHIQTLGMDMNTLSLPPSHPLTVVGSEQSPVGSEQIPAMNPPIAGHVNIANDFNNNHNMSMETNPMLLDQWFLEMLRNSQDAGGSSSMPFPGSDPSFGAV